MNVAFEAVNGVLGARWPNFVGVISSLSPSVVACASKALTRLTVGALRGRRVNGGRRSGCKLFCFKEDTDDFVSKVGPIVNPRLRRMSVSIFVVGSEVPAPIIDCRRVRVAVPEALGCPTRLDFLVVNEVCSGSFASPLGMGGTGGMSSSVAPSFGFVLGVGSLDTTKFWLVRCCSELLETLLEELFEFKETVEETDFRFISGVALVNAGLSVWDGDWLFGDGGCDVRIGRGGGGITERRFIRRVSVGLTVLAPRPVA